ncbi:DUF5957 family protein [Rossellomorea aquimaris]|jgi:hypothetical protein|uniref:Uncharacterized protein n=1 Tax=Rossellomorea aquimaris TaxID=189382 RepID=A0A5D4UJ64_9BACI|nr:DUF5957 family protein [Rossellomorea aquimaris]TYS77947.1 hypothetical protein FZD05_15215 [Rossellomorea aquimaris]TYS86121.1 hypothetical protein FZC88_18445 [Rossellomorea aquimaris]TYS87130.1 hypothetical protein FZC85_09105 [Rossellomorea aquimaris]
MRTFAAIILGLIGGFVLGIALSSVIGIISLGLFNQPFGIKYLPYITAVVCAFLVPMMDVRSLKKE